MKKMLSRMIMGSVTVSLFCLLYPSFLFSRRFLKGKKRWRRVSKDGDGLYMQIRIWQVRQQKVMGGFVPRSGTISHIKMIWALAWMHARVSPGTDREIFGMEEYWATTSETLSLGRGDCEDQAAVLMWKLRELGFPDAAVGIGIAFNRNGNDGHAFAVVHEADHDFWMLDNGAYCPIPVRGSFLFENRKDILPAAGFGFDAVWSYEEKID